MSHAMLLASLDQTTMQNCTCGINSFMFMSYCHIYVTSLNYKAYYENIVAPNAPLVKALCTLFQPLVRCGVAVQKQGSYHV